MGFGDAQIGEQKGHWLGGHARSTVGVHGQLSWGDGVFRTGLGDELLGQGGGLAGCDHPADDVAAKANVQPQRRAP